MMFMPNGEAEATSTSLPAHWSQKRLRSIADLLVSNVDKKEKDSELRVRLCNYVDVYKNDRITERLRFMEATATPDEIERFRLRHGDVVITKDSEAWNDIAVPALVEYEAPDLVCGYHLAILRPRKGMTGSFLLRALQSPDVALQFHVRANGITRYGLSQDAIKSASVPVPPLKEQDAIVRYLDFVDRRVRRYIAAKQRMIRLLEEQKQAIIQQAVTRGLGPDVRLKPSGIEWLGDIPEHWEVVPTRAFFGHRNEKARENEEMLTASQTHGIVSRSTFMEREGRRVMQVITGYDILKHVEPDDFVMSMRSFEGGLEWSKVRGAISSAYVMLTPNEEVHPPYFAFLFKTRAYIAALRRTSDLVRDGQALRYANFVQIPLPSVPLKEQVAIATYLESLVLNADSNMQRVSQEVSLMREYRTRLIADVVTGKLDVRGVELPDESYDEDIVDAEIEDAELGEMSEELAEEEEVFAG